MLDDAKIQDAVAAVLDAAPAGSAVIVFGSYARGQARPDSDLDLLVIEPQVKARRQEMVRLADVLRDLGISADVVVVSRKTFAEWKSTPGTIVYEAAREGRVFGEVA
jgi:predicted nucleotidyltransferase